MFTVVHTRFSQYNPAKFVMSPDEKFILLACHVQKDQLAYISKAVLGRFVEKE
ncbi:hypothetical protein RUM44_005445 [Polyplax serrata]|uniref:Uncharacterized protein n=1 Tax=Polyplax serrata TaxID=468196 RepID=A0ABR1AW64_POLSC